MAQIIFSSFVHFGLLNTIYEAVQRITYSSLVMHNSFLYMIGIAHMWNHYPPSYYQYYMHQILDQFGTILCPSEYKC